VTLIERESERGRERERERRLLTKQQLTIKRHNSREVSESGASGQLYLFFNFLQYELMSGNEPNKHTELPVRHEQHHYHYQQHGSTTGNIRLRVNLPVVMGSDCNDCGADGDAHVVG